MQSADIAVAVIVLIAIVIAYLVSRNVGLRIKEKHEAAMAEKIAGCNDFYRLCDPMSDEYHLCPALVDRLIELASTGEQCMMAYRKFGGLPNFPDRSWRVSKLVGKWRKIARSDLNKAQSVAAAEEIVDYLTVANLPDMQGMLREAEMLVKRFKPVNYLIPKR